MEGLRKQKGKRGDQQRMMDGWEGLCADGAVVLGGGRAPSDAQASRADKGLSHGWMDT